MLLTYISFPLSFEFRLRISLAADGVLSLISRIRNINGKPFSFSFAYHTYLSVSDIRYAGDSVELKSHSYMHASLWLLFVLSFLSCQKIIMRRSMGNENKFVVYSHE